MPSLKNAPLAPFGPSVVLIHGMPFEGIGTVLQKSEPPSKDTLQLQCTALHQKLYHHTCSAKDSPAAMRRACSLGSFLDSSCCPVIFDLIIRIGSLPNVDLVAEKEEEETSVQMYTELFDVDAHPQPEGLNLRHYLASQLLYSRSQCLTLFGAFKD